MLCRVNAYMKRLTNETALEFIVPILTNFENRGACRFVSSGDVDIVSDQNIALTFRAR